MEPAFCYSAPGATAILMSTAEAFVTKDAAPMARATLTPVTYEAAPMATAIAPVASYAAPVAKAPTAPW